MTRELIKVFSSADLALATAISLHYPLEDINKENPRRALFVFNDSPKLQELIIRYWKGELRVEPRLFFDNLKALKARLYANE